MRALAEPLELLVGRLAATLPVRPLVPAVGLLLTVGLLLAVGLLALVPTRPSDVAPVVGRLDMLPEVLPLSLPLTVARPDMLPPVLPPWSGRRELIEPPVPVLPCLTLAT